MRMPLSLLPFVLLALTGPGAAQPLPDPTRPPDYVPEPAPVVIPKEMLSWTLSAIKIAPHSRSAILNGELVRPGDEVGPAKVVGISADAVTLEYNGHKIDVPLVQESIKRPADGNDRKGNSS